jgi:hypothetical protein
LGASEVASKRCFQAILIKPSHYDDDGYVIRWWRSAMPSNSLAPVYGLIDDAAQRGLLGPDVTVDITAIDETNTKVDPRKIAAQFHQAMTPVVDDEVDELELFTHNEGARSAVRHAKHVHDLTHASEAAE